MNTVFWAANQDAPLTREQQIQFMQDKLARLAKHHEAIKRLNKTLEQIHER